MYCLDTSSFVAFINEESGDDIMMTEKALIGNEIVVSPVILTELLSDSKLDDHKITQIGLLPIMEIKDGYWIRAGLMRAKLLKKGFKANTADVLIAQSCIDYNMPLITRDEDFRHFAKHCGLQLAL